MDLSWKKGAKEIPYREQERTGAGRGGEKRWRPRGIELPERHAEKSEGVRQFIAKKKS